MAGAARQVEAERKGAGAMRRSPGAHVLAWTAALLALSACAPRPQDIETGAIASRQPLERAMVDMPPGGPAIVGVVERRYANSTTQEIVLFNRARNPNQNFLKITLFGPVKVTTGPENQQQNDPLALMNAGQEMRWFMPGVKMHVSDLYAQNRYGSFGYATGRASTGDNCIYAWQRIRAPDHDSTMISHQGTVAIRLRFCDPKATDADLLGVMTGFNINAYFLSPGWNPYGSAPPAPEAIGMPGEAVIPSTTLFTGSIQAPEPVVRRRPAVQDEPALDDGMQALPVPAASVIDPTARYEGYATVPPP